MTEKKFPIVFDNHMHLREDGFFMDAVREFSKAGGTAFNLVNILDYRVNPSDYYEEIYHRTLRIKEKIERETEIRVLISLGPYPLDYFYFRDAGLDPIENMKKGLDMAAKIIREGRADAIGEVGRPHFPCENNIVDSSDMMLSYAFDLAKDLSCPVILHTEDLEEEGYSSLEKLVLKSGLNPVKVVKHHAYPSDLYFRSNLTRSILATRKNVRDSIAAGKNFMLETDYVDDKYKPGKVIPANSVPLRAKLIMGEYENSYSILENIFITTPEKVFGKGSIDARTK
ncbi:TatD family hydrolase [Oxyplasma meridianum]|uniref:TatD family hydrolase n=1 Tax=Oxyplasma meridianum TaxID=3073602 RepID=A0AAX4NEX3_9ARCH